MGAGHDHSHGRRASRKRLAWTLAITLLYMVAEAFGGWFTHSLALLADAGHMLSDAAALGLSLFAVWIAERPPSREQTYGYYRAEILAALVNGVTLVVISLLIFWEAWQRFQAPPSVRGGVMMAIAVGGLAANLAGMRILHAGQSDSLNVRGAWLHLATDALGSAGAIVAGSLIWAFGWNWADPAASIAIGLLVLYSSWSLLQESVGVLMEGTPVHIDIDQVRDALMAVPGIRSVHDLHVWTITTGLVALSVHVVSAAEGSQNGVLQRVQKALHDRFGIHHATIQVEPDDGQNSACHVHCALPNETLTPEIRQ